MTFAESTAMELQYTTRRMTQRDLGNVLTLMNSTAVEPPPEDVIDELFDDADTIGIVAETVLKKRSLVIGHLFLSLFKNTSIVIQDLVVHPKYRRLGIGSALLRYGKASVIHHVVPKLVYHCGEYNLGGQLFLASQEFFCIGEETIGKHTFLNMEWRP
jgi:ribosomal protein S18 acetylase RimI-like enzyme